MLCFLPPHPLFHSHIDFPLLVNSMMRGSAATLFFFQIKAHNYSVASSPWRGGKGDVVADLIASCKKYGLRPAVYYSVHENWYEDVCSFNLTSAAKQHAFEDMAMLQLTELAEKYGDALAEIWFDAGVKQSLEFVARVDTFVSQKLPSTATCHSCQNMPSVSAVSWMGNENTVMPYPNWNANDDQCSIMGSGGVFGKAGGTRWCPAHCDAVLRRHFWFWDDKQYNGTNDINTAPMLLGMHLTSVGRGCNIVLDMSPTTTGLLQQDDVDVYAAFGKGLSTLLVLRCHAADMVPFICIWTCAYYTGTHTYTHACTRTHSHTRAHAHPILHGIVLLIHQRSALSGTMLAS